MLHGPVQVNKLFFSKKKKQKTKSLNVLHDHLHLHTIKTKKIRFFSCQFNLKTWNWFQRSFVTQSSNYLPYFTWKLLAWIAFVYVSMRFSDSAKLMESAIFIFSQLLQYLVILSSRISNTLWYLSSLSFFVFYVNSNVRIAARNVVINFI